MATQQVQHTQQYIWLQGRCCPTIREAHNANVEYYVLVSSNILLPQAETSGLLRGNQGEALVDSLG